MILLFDLGNSRCKWQFRERDAIIASGAAAYEHGALPASLLHALDRLPSPPARALACTVAAPALLDPLEASLQRRFGCPLERFRTTAAGGGVRNAYPDPDSLGADRWAALLGARATYPGRVCIVDCGTAVTIDVLEADGQHAGGLILPGLALGRRALSSGAHRLHDAGDGPLPLLATDTATAIRAGTFHSLAGGIETLKRRIDAQGSEPARGVLTGGDADALAAALGPDWQVEPDLVFTGLAREVEAS